jgi:hypothetical protein
MPPKNWGDSPEERKRVRFTNWTPTPKTTLSKSHGLRKQWRFLSKPQEQLLDAEKAKSLAETSQSHQDADVIIGHTFNGSDIEVPITRKDIIEVMEGQYKTEMTLTPMEKHMYMVCDYANQTYGDDPPYCVPLPVEIGAYLEDNQFLLFSEALKARKVTQRSFEKTKYIFIPIPLKDWKVGESTSPHIVLLVVSPFYKTIEFLDSLSQSGLDGGKVWRDDILVKTLNFLAAYLKDSFNAREWRLRLDASPQQWGEEEDFQEHQGECQLAVLSNTMVISFGYGLDEDYFKLQHNTHDPQNPFSKVPQVEKDFNLKVEPNEWYTTMKRKRVASELLHGGFEPWKDGYDEDNPYDDAEEKRKAKEEAGEESDEGDEELDADGNPVEPPDIDNMDYSEEKNPFAYQFGNVDYTAPVYAFGRCVFSPLTEYPGIYERLDSKDPNAKTIMGPNGETKRIVISKPTINPRTAARNQRRQNRAALAGVGTRLNEFFPNNAAQVARRMQTEPRYQALGSMMGVNDRVTARELTKYMDGKRK